MSKDQNGFVEECNFTSLRFKDLVFSHDGTEEALPTDPCGWVCGCPFAETRDCTECEGSDSIALSLSDAKDWWACKLFKEEPAGQVPSNPNPPPVPSKKEDTFSDHYKLSAGPEDIIKMEAIADELEKHGVPAKTIAVVMTACKYYGRMGLKDGQTFEKEVTKCSNYFYRAITGRFFDSKEEG